MARATERQGSLALGGATLDFQRQLWAMADGLRGHMDAAEYKHISDAFAECRKLFLVDVEEDATSGHRSEHAALGYVRVVRNARGETFRII